MEGVLGWDVVGDMELLAKDPFRGRLRGADVSFSQEARRTGFTGCARDWEASWRWSPSSSELASASESGVDVLAFTFSSSRDWLDGAWVNLADEPFLTAFELMVESRASR
jgi:hypothetical protein